MNVVTIDFDIIMAPSIESYNELCGMTNIGLLEQRCEILKYMPADLNIFMQLTDFLIHIIQSNKCKKVSFIKSHERMLQFLEQNQIEHCDLINIDHHHDIGYGKDTPNTENLNCGNWVYIGCQKGLIDNYTWINNENSNTFLADYIVQKPKIISITESQQLLKKLESETDYLVLCASFEWVPTSIRPLFDVWKNIVESLCNIKVDFN